MCSPAAIGLLEAHLVRADLKAGARVLDVGSLYINGSSRHLIESRGWEYRGVDIEAGRNVDDVMPDPYMLPYMDDRWDAVISTGTMEHVERPWRWVPELVRVLKPGGLLLIVTHWQWEHHRWPVDCWRFLPDGFQVLFDDTHALQDYHFVMTDEGHIVGSAFKMGGADG